MNCSSSTLCCKPVYGFKRQLFLSFLVHQQDSDLTILDNMQFIHLLAKLYNVQNTCALHMIASCTKTQVTQQRILSVLSNIMNRCCRRVCSYFWSSNKRVKIHPLKRGNVSGLKCKLKYTYFKFDFGESSLKKL